MRIVLACVLAFATCRPAQPTFSPYAEQARTAEDEARVEWRPEDRFAGEGAALERQRRDGESRRQANEQRESEVQERLAHAVRDPRNAQVAWSALDCWSREQRARAKTAIQEEQRYADDGGGIVDMAKLYGLQGKMRFADKLIAAAKTQLEALKRRRLSCDDKAVRVASSCYSSPAAPCDADKFDTYSAITRAETERAEAAVLAR